MSTSALLNQAFGGVTMASYLALTAIGLSLIFGVVRVLNFAHGSFYMVGAYLAYELSRWFGPSDAGFWAGALVVACVVAALGAVIERLVLRHLYGKDELFQLLFTYGLVLIFSDGVKAIWGVEQVSVARPPALAGRFEWAGAVFPAYGLFISLISVAIVLGLWFVIQRTRVGRIIRAAATDREMIDALGVNVAWLYTGVFAAGCFLAGLGGALVAPVTAIGLGMDAEMIIAAFIAVVIGGMGSFWGTLLGALIYGQVLAFGILFIPEFSLFAVFALMAVVLIVRPHGLLGSREAVRV
ncbi:MAG TPA: branched-chain amino acid ABC transporter permease [Azospirillum sp.]|nr:branched-chain amino acid ABC transporter permease [Azospirillum sp.]